MKHELTWHVARISFPLHFALAEDPTSLPPGQQRLGVPKVRPLEPAPGGTIAIYGTGTAYSTLTWDGGIQSWANETDDARTRPAPISIRDIIDTNETNDMAFNQY